jgi:4'-phosphopantetheinyl transferase
MPIRDEWLTPPSKLSLGKDQVHLWRACLDLPAYILQNLTSVLSPDEISRASRFVFDKDRNHFVVARAILREILGGYLNVEPAELRFQYGQRLKPTLDLAHHGSGVRFNVSHSCGMAAYAFAFEREVGVDLELIRPSFAGIEIAERFFSRAELAELRGLSAALQSRGFFLCWTRKEAYVKARGEGLHIPLDEFDVSLTPGQAETLKSVDDQRWTLRSFEPQEEWVGAVVAEGAEWQMRKWQWIPDNDGIARRESATGDRKY